MRITEKLGNIKNMEVGVFEKDRIYFDENRILPRIDDADELIKELKKIHKPNERLNIKLFFTLEEDYNKFCDLNGTKLVNSAKLYLESPTKKMDKFYSNFTVKSLVEVFNFNQKLLGDSSLPALCYKEMFEIPLGNRREGLYKNHKVLQDKVIQKLIENDTQAVNFFNPNYFMKGLDYYKNDINSAYPYFLMQMLPCGEPLKEEPQEAHTALYVIEESFTCAPLTLYPQGGSGAEVDVKNRLTVVWSDDLKFRQKYFINYQYRVLDKRYFRLRQLESNCAAIYQAKEEAPKGSLARKYYKYCLNIPIGVIGMLPHNKEDYGAIHPRSYYPIASFVWMKERIRMLTYAYEIGIRNVISIATDEIDTFTPLDNYRFIHYSNKCGDFKCEYKEDKSFLRGNLIFDSRNEEFDKHSGYSGTVEEIYNRTFGNNKYIKQLKQYNELEKQAFNLVLDFYEKNRK